MLFRSVLHKEDLQLVLADGVLVDLGGEGVDQPDDPLGHSVAGSGLGTENKGVGLHLHVGVILELVIEMDDVHHVQQLPLVLVEALDLNVEDGVGIDDEALGLLGVLGEGLLVGPLDLVQTEEDLLVLGELFQLGQLRAGMEEIGAAAGEVADELVQAGVDLRQPAAEIGRASCRERV